MDQTTLDSRATLVIDFHIGGRLRFLSHQETMRTFTRALVRAKIEICHSQGFNPHPKLTLVLPRSVGTESLAERLCVQVNKSSLENLESLRESLSNELPDGIEITSFSAKDGIAKYSALWVEYLFPLSKEEVKKRINLVESLSKKLSDSEAIVAQRVNRKKRISKQILLNDFIENIVYNESEGIRVRCMLSPAGTVRIEELLNLLELDIETLSAAVTRLSVGWHLK